MAFYTYILASRRNGTLYLGSTDDLPKRVWEHQEKHRRGFTAKYGADLLVGYEVHDLRETAFFTRAPNEEVEPRLENSTDRTGKS